MTSFAWDKYVKEIRRPLGTVRQCKLCGRKELVRKGQPGAGRSYGLREGNKARGRMIQHLRKDHRITE